MKILLVKLKNGETYIGKVQEKAELTLTKVRQIQLLMGPKGPSVTPLPIILGTKDTYNPDWEVPMDDIMFSAYTEDIDSRLVDQYMSLVSEVQLAPKNSIIL